MFPIGLTAGGTEVHLGRAKSTEFCLSCHVMEPYGRSLLFADLDHLPAGHYQNNRVPRDQACYSCHTEYTMFGPSRAKLRGLRHLYVYYFGELPAPGKIELYEPYRNRECFHCHATSRGFLELDDHLEELPRLQTDEVSCLECHEDLHAAGEQEGRALWVPPRPGVAGPAGALLPGAGGASSPGPAGEGEGSQ